MDLTPFDIDVYQNVFRAVITANMLSVCVFYGMWRCTKDETRLTNILWVLVPALIAGVLSL